MSDLIGRQTASYRQGLVLGLTMAEIMLLLVFCLLIAVGVSLASERAKRDDALLRLKQVETAAASNEQMIQTIRRNARLADFLADREKRTLRMRDALREVGFELDEAEIEQRIAEGKPIGRPHLAGAVLRAPANAERLRSEGIDDIGSLIRAYLIEGRPAFRLRETPTVAQAVMTITGKPGREPWMSLSRSRPLRPGMRISVISTSGASPRSAVNALSA